MALLTPPALLHKDKDKDPDAEPDKDGEAAGPVSVTRVRNSLVSGKPNIMCGGWCLASLTGASPTAADPYAVDSFVRARFVERGLVDFWSACLCVCACLASRITHQEGGLAVPGTSPSQLAAVRGMMSPSNTRGSSPLRRAASTGEDLGPSSGLPVSSSSRRLRSVGVALFVLFAVCYLPGVRSKARSLVARAPHD